MNNINNMNNINKTDNIINNKIFDDIIIINKKKEEKNIVTEKYSKTVEMKNLMPIMDYNDDEINDLSYYLALQNDKRTYWQYYMSLIKTKHELIFTFFYNKDYNSKIIDLFLFGFGLNCTVNGFFFNDETMHNVYKSKGLFDLDYQLPIIIYSSFISMFLGALMQMLGLSSDAISDFKQSKELENINEKEKKLIKKQKIKFVFYFLLSSLLLLFFWYYVSMFYAVYTNTQYLLLKDTLFGYGLSLIFPFIIYLFPGFFRIPTLKEPQKSKRCLYNLSKIFTIL